MEPKSTLPPRKRARTKEEKEQRRVERILRNRRAAHQSREKKRKYVETLENHIEKLIDNLRRFEHNQALLSNHVNQDVLSHLKVIDDLNEFNDFKFDTKRKEKKKEDDDEEEEEELKEPQYDLTPELSDPNTSFSEPSVEEPESDNSINEQVIFDPSFDYDVDFFIPKHDSFNGPITPSDDVNFNYLSPVSINTPSPMNLSLDIDLSSTVHNSEVVVT